VSEAIISVEGLGNRYRIRHQQQGGVGYKALRDVLADTTKSVGKRLWSIIPAFQHFSVSAFALAVSDLQTVHPAGRRDALPYFGEHISAFSFSACVEVGTPVARRPPHRSRRAVFPHRALRAGTSSSLTGRFAR